MKAALLTEGGRLTVEEIAAPTADGWALVDTKAAGVCGTELHFLDGMIPPPYSPFVLGHEIAGVVLESPPGSAARPGDRVAVYNFVGCSACHWCRTGRMSICRNPVGQLGFSLDGGFRDVVRVPAANLVPLPDGVSFETAAVLACAGMSAVHATRLARVGLGSTAIVNGIGGVGLSVVQVARAAGARVIAVADGESKAELAREHGAWMAIVVEDYGELPGRTRELTGGAGADFFFELVGTGETMRAGIRSLGPDGCLALIGYTGDDLAIHPIELILSEIRVVSSVAADRQDLETAIRLSADGLLRAHIDTRYPIEEIGTAVDRLRARQVQGRNVLVW